MKFARNGITDFPSFKRDMGGALRTLSKRIAAIDDFDVHHAKHTAIAVFARSADRPMRFPLEEGRQA